MRALSFIVSALLAGSAFAQAPASVHTPIQRDADVPTYINATVVRVDPRHDTITFRSESGEVSLTVEGDAVAGLPRLRPGDEVVLGYRVDNRSGRPAQIVTAILAGEEMAQRGFVSTSTPAARLGTSGVGTVQSSGRGTVTTFGPELAGTGSVATTTGTMTTGSATVAGVVPSGATLPGTTANASSLNGGAQTTPLGTLPGTTTTNTLAGAANVNGLNTVAGQPGVGTVSSPGVSAGIGDVANTGTFTTGASPLASQIPSLPSVVGQLNVVPPPTAAPALTETLPVGAARDVATRDYDAGVRAMAMKANEIDAHWFGYRDGCLRTGATSADIDRNLYAPNRDRQWFLLFDGEVGTPVDDNCRQLLIEMTRMSNDWKDTMTRLEDAARKNDVLPGAMREIRQRYRVEF